MDWSWKVFSIILPLAITFSMFSRGVMNAQNIARHGPKADYRENLGMAIFGSITSGGVLSAILTAVIGLF
jgi:hypothetical protein